MAFRGSRLLNWKMESGFYMNEKNKIDRRDALKGAAASICASGIPWNAAVAKSDPGVAITAKSKLIEQENKKEGTRDWQLTRVRINEGKYRTSLIEGYCSKQSVAAGEELNIHVSTKPARKFVIDIYRMGYYGGKGARHLKQIGPLQGSVQATPEMQPAPGRLRECKWDVSATLVVPDDWLSGVYLGKLTTIPESKSEPYWQSYVIFIVRDNRRADFLFQCSDNTWQAYNRWPVNESLYTHPAGAHAPGVSVSFDRPYGKYCQIFDAPLSIGSGEFLLWEFPLSYWIEKHGYDVTYGSNSDSIDASFITRCQTFLSVGHDEYWDLRQYKAVEKAIESGVNILWLCGNAVFVVSTFSNSSSNRPKRIITRTGSYGPMRREETETYPKLFTGLKQGGPDERNIMGVRSVVPFNGGGDWTCVNPTHWIFAGTGMKQGESIPGLVGWEHHGEPDPERAELEVLAEGKVWSGGTREGEYSAVIFPGPEGNIVFNASTIFWSQGLSSPPGHMPVWSHWSRPHGPDPRVQQMTHNLLQECLRRWSS